MLSRIAKSFIRRCNLKSHRLRWHNTFSPFDPPPHHINISKTDDGETFNFVIVIVVLVSGWLTGRMGGLDWWWWCRCCCWWLTPCYSFIYVYIKIVFIAGNKNIGKCFWRKKCSNNISQHDWERELWQLPYRAIVTKLLIKNGVYV